MSNLKLKGQTHALLQGDLTPEFTDYADLRNDNAGSELQQMRMIILRYLENRLGDETVQSEEMFGDIAKRYPFIGDQELEFFEALDTLIEDNFVRTFEKDLSINKVARVASRWLNRRFR